jgi:hypothetical protein
MNLGHIYLPQSPNMESHLFRNTKIGKAFKATATPQQLKDPQHKT